MSETSILPGAGPVDAGGPMVPTPPDVDEPGGDSRRRLMILGMIAAVVVIAAAAYMLLHKSSSDTTATPPAPVPTTATHTGTTGSGSGSGAPTKGKPAHHGAKSGQTLPRKSHTALVRDPFHPLVSAPTTNSTGTTPTGTTTTPPVSTTTVTPPPSTVTTPVVQPTTPTSGGTPTTGTNGQTTSGQPLWVRLVSVDGTKDAVFDVGYAHHKFRRFKVIAPGPLSARGTVFDGEFALLGVQGGTATIQEGDATPFDLNTGESHAA